jgi:septum site-determining protein MinC
MTAPLADRTPVSFEIKSANLPLVALWLKSGDLGQVATDWEQRFRDIPDFFEHDPLVIELSQLPPDVSQLDFKGLMKLLRQYKLAPLVVKGGNKALMAQALKSGLGAAPEVEATTPKGRARGEPASEPVVQEVVREVVREVIVEVVKEVHIEVPAPAAPQGLHNAMVIDKPLRSGQQVYAKGRDLVVLAMVNAGAEVIADGNIHVYAPLRGKAIAGAKGNAEARIFTLCLEAELISIAGVYRTSDVPLPADVLGKPTHIRLTGGADSGKLVMQALKA